MIGMQDSKLGGAGGPTLIVVAPTNELTARMGQKGKKAVGSWQAQWKSPALPEPACLLCLLSVAGCQTRLAQPRSTDSVLSSPQSTQASASGWSATLVPQFHGFQLPGWAAPAHSSSYQGACSLSHATRVDVIAPSCTWTQDGGLRGAGATLQPGSLLEWLLIVGPRGPLASLCPDSDPGPQHFCVECIFSSAP